MRVKTFAALALLVVVLVGAAVGAGKLASSSESCCYPGSPRCDDCCYPGSPCCYPGSPCCDGCCEPASSCCPAETTSKSDCCAASAKKGTCCSD
jgi:hypothetical protein